MIPVALHRAPHWAGIGHGMGTMGGGGEGEYIWEQQIPGGAEEMPSCSV